MVQSPSNSISMNTRDWDNEPKCNYYSVYIIMPWILVLVYLHKQGHVHDFEIFIPQKKINPRSGRSPPLAICIIGTWRNNGKIGFTYPPEKFFYGRRIVLPSLKKINGVIFLQTLPVHVYVHIVYVPLWNKFSRIITKLYVI